MKEIKIAACQMEVIPGHPDENAKKIITYIEEAKHLGDEIIAFPEMSVPGYLLGDEWENEAFISDCYSFNEDIIAASKNIIVIWGNVDIDKSKKAEDGRTRKYNAAFIAQNGKLISVVHKTLMPKYREFDDERHFYSFYKESIDSGKGITEMLLPVPLALEGQTVQAGVILCEDMWSDDYAINPVNILLKNGADFILNLSCSPWTWRKNDKRHRVIKDRLSEKPAPFVYVNNVGTQNNGKNIFLFDGNSTFYNPDGSLEALADDYTEQLLRSTIFSAQEINASRPELSHERDLEELYNGLIYGIRKFFAHCGMNKVLLGLSGGVDSSLCATLMAKAIGPENVYGVNMPTKYNSGTTKDIAAELAQNLGIHYSIVPIQESYSNTVKQLNQVVFVQQDGSGIETPVILSPLNEENVQARDRGSRVLAGLASAIGAIFTNNGNKSETTIGYATLYGDVNGAIAPIADLYKTEVFDLCRYINSISGEDIIPKQIFEIPPSAELSADQNIDEGKGDPILYPYHDRLFRAFVEFRLDPEKILELYINNTLTDTLKVDTDLFNNYFKTPESFINDLEHKWRMFKINYFKRIQAPPIIAVSKRAFGFDLRESQMAPYFTRRYNKLKMNLLDRNLE